MRFFRVMISLENDQTTNRTNFKVRNWNPLSLFVFLLALAFVPTSFVPTKVCLPRQNFCLDKIMFVAIKLCNMFLATKVLSRQAYFCHDKRHVLSRQTRVCRDKSFVATKMILVAAPANDIELFFLNSLCVLISLILTQLGIWAACHCVRNEEQIRRMGTMKAY